MLFRTLAWCKQTTNPPKRVIPIGKNPLTWWCRAMPPWRAVPTLLPRTRVGVEGCHSAFNATNTIRSCMYFAPEHPPAFLTLSAATEIRNIQWRSRAGGSTSAAEGDSGASLEEMASFGEGEFLHGAASVSGPIVALENFAERAESIAYRRLASPVRVIVGHENLGVRDKFLSGGGGRPLADAVVYFPIYGTISSLNAVTSLGIALFYAFLDTHFPQSRSTLPLTSTRCSGVASPDACVAPTDLEQQEQQQQRAEIARRLKEYQDAFQRLLPAPSGEEETFINPATHAWKTHENTKPRVDERPIHPLFYRQTPETIVTKHRELRELMLTYSRLHSKEGGPSASMSSSFGISVLYENEFDQRNFGGLLRCCNAFLVDHVFYVGRRKVNVVGAVGSNHYTPPVYLGPMPASGAAAAEEDDAQWLSELQGHATKDGPPPSLWLLDCGHFLKYQRDCVTVRNLQSERREVYPSSNSNSSSEGQRDDKNDCGPPEATSSAQSLEWYFQTTGLAKRVHLCMTEEELHAEMGTGVVLVVPQEGKLPHFSILRRCTHILSILPQAELDNQGDTCRGLPSQVACGIALQRLSAILHPALFRL